MNYLTIPLHRPHSNIRCACRACHLFDCAETAEMQRPAVQPTHKASYEEQINAIHTETGTRSTYYRKAGSYYEVVYAIDTEVGTQITYHWPIR